MTTETLFQAPRLAENMPADQLTPEEMQDDVLLAERVYLGDLALREATDADTANWYHRARSLLAASGQLTPTGELQPELMDQLFAKWQGTAASSEEPRQEAPAPVPFSAPTETQAAAPIKQKRRTAPFANGFKDYGISEEHRTRAWAEKPIPEAIFSNQEPPQKSPPPRAYTPTFDLKYLAPTFAPDIASKAEQALHEAATKLNVQPGDAEGKVRAAREAFKSLHPDRNPGQPAADQDVAKALSSILQHESANPEAKAARAARIEHQQANETPTPQPEAAPAAEAPAVHAPATEAPAPTPQLAPSPTPTPEAKAA
jgi:hypothetical protein